MIPWTKIFVFKSLKGKYISLSRCPLPHVIHNINLQSRRTWEGSGSGSFSLLSSLFSFLPLLRPQNYFYKKECQAVKELTDCSSENAQPKKWGKKQIEHVITGSTVGNCFKHFLLSQKKSLFQGKSVPWSQWRTFARVSPVGSQWFWQRKSYSSLPPETFLQLVNSFLLAPRTTRWKWPKKPVWCLGGNFLHYSRVREKGIETARWLLWC